MMWVEPRSGCCVSAFHFNGSAHIPIEKPTSDFFLFHRTRTTIWLCALRKVRLLCFFQSNDVKFSVK